MNNLFKESELDKLIDASYITNSHTFSKGVIAAYYNGLEYPLEVTNDYIKVKRRKENVYFKLGEKPLLVESLDKDIIYSDEKKSICKNKIKEVVYDLEKIFSNPSKQVKRGIRLDCRHEVSFQNYCEKEQVKLIYNEWVQYKNEDPKVYKIAFTPKRYLRSFQLEEKGFNIIERTIFINQILYAVICFEVQGDLAFELAFLSRFWRKDLKITNDLNELILISCFDELSSMGIRKVNVGPTAGIKGLRTFKNKLPHEYVEIYSN